ncbi:ABC-2 type transport system permease protein [Jatrophihabitans endophyticus]|uniref:ABC-2 type transport system permease protein n=1 Tax=Jatrophihabitans endophyticus TaxID=1206085 RepID=A0A1M5GLN7_9ACTN|nr:ABC transporter permease [Jatrophihabitans endophyticus]SHG04596.1 ABC-2 type transport system permease protein [Jatrophihabitans endophyticus]
MTGTVGRGPVRSSGSTAARRVLLNARLQWDELVHLPAVTVPSLALPLVTYLIFGAPNVHGSSAAAAGALVGFAGFALLGIVMFQFGVGIAADRESPWERYVRTLPAGPGQRFAARLLVALGFGVAALVPLCVCAVLVTPVDLDVAAWLRVIGCLLVGAVPLGLLGIMLGYLFSERGALPLTNLLYLPLSYAGGLFNTRPDDLPRVVAAVSPWLPTRQWSDLLLYYGLGGVWPTGQSLALAGYAVAFAVLAVVGYRRDEQRQYR